MSTLRVNAIQNASGTDAISIGSDGSLSYPNIGRRNLIINGAMQVAQRGTSATGITGIGYQACDRWRETLISLGTWTLTQDTSCPDGFASSLKFTNTTADASPASSDIAWIDYWVEAQDLQQLAYGTSSAKAMTLSFWVKSNKTGNASFEIQQTDNSDKHITAQYTINAADTWEQKTILIPGDSAGVIDNNNDRGMHLIWWLNGGSDYTGGSFQGSWASLVNANRNVSNLGVGGATSDYFAITGVQLEVGSVATPFEHRSYGEELALCQRYYWKVDGTTHPDAAIGSGTNISTTRNRLYVKHPVPMRTQPTASMSGTMVFGSGGATAYSTSIQAAFEGVMSSMVDFATSGLTVGYGAIWYMDSSNPSYYFQFDAEL